jgi:N-formylglutamate deformylase
VLTEEIERIQARHGYVLLYDCHSICSVLPRFFEGRLPTLNIGTGDGSAADAELTGAVEKIAAASPFSHAVNGRFKGGYITRHYGIPSENVQALQMELAQADYMLEEAPFSYLPEKAAALQPTLKKILDAMLDYGRNQLAR